MTAYLQRMEHKFSLFDAPLVYNFSQISRTENADLTQVFEDTLVKHKPINAVVRGAGSQMIHCGLLPQQPHRYTKTLKDSGDESRYVRRTLQAT